MQRWEWHGRGPPLAACALAATALACVVYWKYPHAPDPSAEIQMAETRRLNNPRLYEPACDQPRDREEADLCAQREMSKTARDLYNLTIVQVVLGVVGTLAVLGALGAALQSNRITRKQYLASQRPWLVVSKVKPLVVELTKGLSISFELAVRNSGQSVGLNVVHSAKLHISHMGDLADEQRAMLAEVKRQRPSHLLVNVGDLVVPGEDAIMHRVSASLRRRTIEAELRPAHREVIELQGLSVMLICCLAYGSNEDQSQHFTQQTFLVQRIVDPTLDNPRGRANLRLGTVVAANEIAFDPFPTGNYSD